MGENWVGSEDVAVHPSAARAANGNTGWFDLEECENFELDLTISAFSGATDDKKIIVESDMGAGGPNSGDGGPAAAGVVKTHVIHTFEPEDTTDLSAVVSLGAHPGARRIRCRYVVPDGSITFVLTARETRSGDR